jgi:Effector Associated Constant Component 1
MGAAWGAVVEFMVGVAGAADDVRSLRQWLAAEEEFRGRVRPVEEPARPEVLGPTLTELLVDLAGPAGVVLASALVAWARSRRGDVELTVRRRGAETIVRLSARRVRGLAMDKLPAEIEQLGQAFDALARPDGAAGPEIGGGHGPAPAGGDADGDEAGAGPGRQE